MKRKIIIYIIFLTMFILLFLYIFTKRDLKDTVIQEIQDNAFLINKSCKMYGLDSRGFVSVIYGELKNNLNSLDELDNIRAKLGFDPSVGFTQMRVSTFKWIEDNYADGKIIKMSSSRDEMIRKLIVDSTNILYSVFYVKLIHDKLLSKLGREPSIRLLASYYGKGIDYYRGNDIDSLYYNPIGITAEEFYNSNKLLNFFPK